MLSAIVTFAVTAAKAVAALGLAVEGLKALGNILTVIGKALGLIKPETQVDELGDKALQAEEKGITPDQFETYEKYVKAIEGFQLDPEKSRETTLEEKVEKGIELTVGVIREKFPELSVETVAKLGALIERYPTVFTEDSMRVFTKDMISDPSCAEKVIGYLDHTEKNQDHLAGAERILTEMIKTADPSMDDGAVRRQLYSL